MLLAVPNKHLRQNKELLIFVFRDKNPWNMKRSKATDKKRIKRVEEMEASYDKVLSAMEKLREGMSLLEDCKADIEGLEEYSSSGAWLEDFEADEAGLLPEGMKRGVLSEDGLFDLLSEIGQVRSLLSKTDEII